VGLGVEVPRVNGLETVTRGGVCGLNYDSSVSSMLLTLTKFLVAFFQIESIVIR